MVGLLTYQKGGGMAIPLNDLRQKEVVAHFLDTQNYSETARAFNVSDKTLKRIVEKSPNVVKEVEHIQDNWRLILFISYQFIVFQE